MALVSGERARTAANVISMGALIEAIGGVAAIVLGILGLAGLITDTMLAVITIIIGVALVLQGMEITAEYSAALANGDESAVPASRGMTIELLVGGAGIVLGILALVAANAHFLVPAALIVFGGSLMLAGVAGAQMFPSNGAHRETAEGHVLEVARQSRSGAAGVQVMVGIAAIILGVLAYVLPSVAPTLLFVGLIAVGGSLLLTSAAATTFAELIARPTRWHREEPGVPPTPGGPREGVPPMTGGPREGV
jgi:hypothetical protein